MHPIFKGYCSQTISCMTITRMAPYALALMLLHLGAPSATAETAPPSPGKWRVLTAPSAEADSLTLSLKAEKAVTGWMKTSVPTLTIQCSKGKAALYIETEMALEVTVVDQQIVRVQLDGNASAPQRWREVTNATVSASTRDATSLIKQFTQSQKFMFEFTSFNGAPVQAEFAVTGLSAYAPQLNRACWGK